MAQIKPFKGLRYTKKAGRISELVCPPYDIVSPIQREEYIKANPHNLIRLELPSGGEDRYREAGETLSKWLQGNVLDTDSKEGIYVYEMAFNVKGEAFSVKGFVTLVKIEEFERGVVLPHEETLSKAKTDRFNLMSETFCNFSQIYSLYMDEDKSTFSIIDSASQGAPDIEITDGDGVTHKLWCVYDSDIISAVQDKFSDKKLYIADGHHRYETALNFRNSLRENGNGDGNEDYVMMMLVNMENDGLVVLPTHRIIRGMQGFNLDSLLEKCGKHFDITELSAEKIECALDEQYAKGSKALALYTTDATYLLVLSDGNAIAQLLPNASDAYCGLDVTTLHTLVLERALGIDKANMAAQINLTYTRSADEAIAEVDSGNANCAFILNPTRVDEIRDVAANGEKMPQKSTYFYPKLITGLVMNKIK